MEEREFIKEISEYMARGKDEDLIEKIEEIHAFFKKIFETQISILERLENLEKTIFDKEG